MAALSGLASGNYLNLANMLSKRQLYSVGDDILAVGFENRKGGDVRVFYYYNLTKGTYQRPAGALSRFFGGFFIALIFFLCGLGFVNIFNTNRWTDGDTVGFIVTSFFFFIGLCLYFAWHRTGKIKKVFLSELNKLNIRL
jgi:hypothetical protein